MNTKSAIIISLFVIILILGAIDYYFPLYNTKSSAHTTVLDEKFLSEPSVLFQVNEALNRSGNPAYIKSVTYNISGDCEAYITSRQYIVITPCNRTRSVVGGYLVQPKDWIKFAVWHEIAHAMFNTSDEFICNNYAMGMVING